MMISSLVRPQHAPEPPSVISSPSSSSTSMRLLPTMEDTFTVDVRNEHDTTTTTTTTKTTKKKSSNLLKKSVSFTTVEIRHYPITIDIDETLAEGRNDKNNYNYYGQQQRGLPVTLDWWWNDSKAVSSSSTSSSSSLSSSSSSSCLEDGNHNNITNEHNNNNNTTIIRLDTPDQKNQKNQQHQVVVLGHGLEQDEEVTINKKNYQNNDKDRQPDVTSCSSSSCSSSSTSSSPSPESIISNNCSSDNDNNDNSMRNNAYCRRDELGLQMTPMQRIRKLRRAGFTLQELHTAMKHKRGSI